MTIKFISPIYIILPRKTKKDKKIALNLNVYRNLHFQINNQMKEKYNQIMSEQLNGKVFDVIKNIEFVLYKPSRRKIDRSNILCIVEKFFCDALVNCGCIKDDDDNYIKSTAYRTDGIDIKNPRCEIFIR